MKGEKRLRILELLKGSARLAGDIFLIFALPYGTSYSRMDYFIGKSHEDEDLEAIRGRAINKRTKRNFDVFLYRLKKDGLIEKSGQNGKIFFKITPKGKEIFESLRTKILPRKRYRDEGVDMVKIIIFDIPEKEKNKREWLREALKNLNYIMIQKSVWMGKAKLPKDFIKDLNQLSILNYVEIFAITRAGSLKSIKI